MMRYRCLLLAIALMAARLAIAQASRSVRCDAISCKATFAFGPEGIPDAAAAPYSGQKTGEWIKLPDGTRMTMTAASSGMIYRDSQGRIRAEHPLFPSRPGAKNPMDVLLVEIQDPLAGYVYVLDSFHRVAHRVPVQPPKLVVPRVFSTDRNEPATESLGTKFMFGVAVTGLKTTSISHNNGQPITNVIETWTDPLNGILVLRRSTNPTGEFTITMQNYSNAEPDSALFLIPPEYAVVEESGPFTIEIPRTR